MSVSNAPTPRSKQEIDAEVEKLKNLRPKIVPYSMFGDSNIRALDIMIETLEKGYSINHCADVYESTNDYDHALAAAEWAAGYDNEDGLLHEGWPLKEKQND